MISSLGLVSEEKAWFLRVKVFKLGCALASRLALATSLRVRCSRPLACPSIFFKAAPAN
jgi:hypothetical protein